MKLLNKKKILNLILLCLCSFLNIELLKAADDPELQAAINRYESKEHTPEGAESFNEKWTYWSKDGTKQGSREPAIGDYVTLHNADKESTCLAFAEVIKIAVDQVQMPYIQIKILSKAINTGNKKPTGSFALLEEEKLEADLHIGLETGVTPNKCIYRYNQETLSDKIRQALNLGTSKKTAQKGQKLDIPPRLAVSGKRKREPTELYVAGDASGERTQKPQAEAPYWQHEGKKWYLLGEKEYLVPPASESLSKALKIKIGDIVAVWQEDDHRYHGKARVTAIARGQRQKKQAIDGFQVRLEVIEEFDYQSPEGELTIWEEDDSVEVENTYLKKLPKGKGKGRAKRAKSSAGSSGITQYMQGQFFSKSSVSGDNLRCWLRTTWKMIFFNASSSAEKKQSLLDALNRKQAEELYCYGSQELGTLKKEGKAALASLIAQVEGFSSLEDLRDLALQAKFSEDFEKIIYEISVYFLVHNNHQGHLDHEYTARDGYLQISQNEMGMHYQMQDIVRPLGLEEFFDIKYTNLAVQNEDQQNPYFISQDQVDSRFQSGDILCCAIYNGVNHWEMLYKRENPVGEGASSSPAAAGASSPAAAGAATEAENLMWFGTLNQEADSFQYAMTKFAQQEEGFIQRAHVNIEAHKCEIKITAVLSLLNLLNEKQEVLSFEKRGKFKEVLKESSRRLSSKSEPLDADQIKILLDRLEKLEKYLTGLSASAAQDPSQREESSDDHPDSEEEYSSDEEDESSSDEEEEYASSESESSSKEEDESSKWSYCRNGRGTFGYQHEDTEEFITAAQYRQKFQK